MTYRRLLVQASLAPLFRIFFSAVVKNPAAVPVGNLGRSFLLCAILSQRTHNMVSTSANSLYIKEQR